MCREEELTKRIALLQKFIKIAVHCLRFKNLNSFYAILLALESSAAVSRLKLTWKEIPRRQKTQFRRLKPFLDTTMNFKKLREFSQQQKPPLVPYLPVILKGLQQNA